MKSLYNTTVAAYHDNVIDYFEKPRNVGSLNKNDKNVGTGNMKYPIVILNLNICYVIGLVGAPACGDVMKLQIKVKEDGKTIEEAVFKVYFFLIFFFIRDDANDFRPMDVVLPSLAALT